MPETVARTWGWHYRTLLALRDHLAGASGDRIRESLDPMEPPSYHPEDEADELYDRELDHLLPNNRIEALREVEAAIERLKSRVYGRCESTGRRISRRQLRAIPWQRYADGVTAPL